MSLNTHNYILYPYYGDSILYAIVCFKKAIATPVYICHPVIHVLLQMLIAVDNGTSEKGPFK